jgi:hypothetical protein
LVELFAKIVKAVLGEIWIITVIEHCSDYLEIKIHAKVIIPITISTPLMTVIITNFILGSILDILGI